MTRGRCAVVSALLALAPATVVYAAQTMVVTQAGRAFSVPQIRLRRGDSIRFENADSFIHQIGTQGAGFGFASDEQVPGKALDVRFPVAGLFTVRCEIHPRMALAVTVE